VHRRTSMHLHLCSHYSSCESVTIVTATSDAPLVGIAKRSGAPDEIVSKRNDASANSRRDLQRAQMPRPRPGPFTATHGPLTALRALAFAILLFAAISFLLRVLVSCRDLRLSPRIQVVGLMLYDSAPVPSLRC